MTQSHPETFSRGLHWCRHDLRVEDNEALQTLVKSCDKVSLVYIFNPNEFEQESFGYTSLGKHRRLFLDQALLDLKEHCHNAGIECLFLQGKPRDTLSKIIHHADIQALSYEFHAGLNERQDIQYLKETLKNVSFIEGRSNYLLSPKHLPFSIEDMPNVFSPFRRKVEKQLRVRSACSSIQANSKDSALEQSAIKQLNIDEYTPQNRQAQNGYTGGQSAALSRIDEYFFETDNIASYKETRNGLDGWDFSSRFSAYLALGCISPAYIYEQLKDYENRREKNDSTYWLFFELLWREFFHLQAIKHNHKLFTYGGIQSKPPSNNHDQAKFDTWVKGETSYPIVDACMKQVAKTGFMSNRGRQLVASCFVHELALDWRWGARYFEHILVDFDVASNYGNWQYLAGVGSDPRGHRQFNLDKQTDIYDPNRAFINSWLA